jgi:Phosphotransferase enzyme family
LPDKVFEDRPKAGPFASIKDFYEWLEWLPQRLLPESQRFIDPYVQLLPVDATIKFTHGDMHQTNVIISTTSPPRVLAVIDWGQSGWYPDYWEHCKASYTCWWEDEWFIQWVPKILEPRTEENHIFSEYTMTIGAV